MTRCYFIAFSLKNKKYNAINLANLVITMFAVTCCNFLKGIEPIFPVVLWGIYIVYDLLRAKDNRLDSFLGWANYFVLTFFCILLFHDAHQQLGYLFVTTAAVYLVLALASRFLIKTEQYKTYEYYILANIWLYVLQNSL